MHYEFFVVKDGAYVPLSSLTPEEQRDIRDKMTKRMADEIAKEQAKPKAV